MASNSKPFLRSKLAQSVYDRMLTDEKLKNMDFTVLYKLDELSLNDSAKNTFLQMSFDGETKQFVDTCFEQADFLLLQIWHAIAKSFLGIFMSQTSVNGLLNRGRMFVWSTDQARRLLEGRCEDHFGDGQFASYQDATSDELTKDSCTRDFIFDIENESIPKEKRKEGICSGKDNDDEVYEDAYEYPSSSSHCRLNERPPTCHPSLCSPVWWSNKIVLDLGAGDGHVTQILAEAAKKVYVTENSPVMRKRLSGRGYKVLNVDSWLNEVEDVTYDLITCLNLLDRCDTPLSLMRDIHQKLSSEGKLVVALVLPISPYVETGTADHEPSENLGVQGYSIEEQVNHLIEVVFPKLGFRVSRWTRLPYLCEGDLDQAFYWLSDIVFILEKIENFHPTTEDFATYVNLEV